MIPVAQATQTILQSAASFGETTVSLMQATGRILAEPLYADRDFPPFDRVSMDGIAIRYEAYRHGRREFAIEKMQAAGDPRQALDNSTDCIEVMTGAILPDNTDTVIRYEDLEIHRGVARVVAEKVRRGQNAHPRAKDRKQGDLLVPAGRQITPAEIGIAATVGKAELRVLRHPRTAIIYTGDELVEVDYIPLEHQIRASNVYTIQSFLHGWGFTGDPHHLLDAREPLKTKLEECLDNYDILLLTGGVSKGKFDFVPEVLEELGVAPLFFKVAQRPGKPFWFGQSAEGKTVFAFPGNPVSAFMCTLRYFHPWLRKSLGQKPALPTTTALLTEEAAFKPSLTYFLPVRLKRRDDGLLAAHPHTGHGSGDLANLAEVDGFLEMPAEREVFRKGEAFRVWGYRVEGKAF